MRVRTSERRIVLDAVVHADVTQVERVGPVALAEQAGHVTWHEEAERGREVERRTDGRVHLAERDVAPGAGEQACTESARACLRQDRHDVIAPWLASAFRPGHALRLSPSLGGMYSGQRPPAPGQPSGTTRSAGRSGATRLNNVSPRSHTTTPRFVRMLSRLEMSPTVRRVDAMMMKGGISSRITAVGGTRTAFKYAAFRYEHGRCRGFGIDTKGRI